MKSRVKVLDVQRFYHSSIPPRLVLVFASRPPEDATSYASCHQYCERGYNDGLEDVLKLFEQERIGFLHCSRCEKPHQKEYDNEKVGN